MVFANGGEKVKAQEAEAKEADTVEAFAWRWYAEVAEPANSNPRNIKRVLEKDVIPAIGTKQIADVTVMMCSRLPTPSRRAAPIKWPCKPATC
jgi:hypothetical protein